MTKDEFIDAIRKRLADVTTEPYGGRRVESEYAQGVEQGSLSERRAIAALLADYDAQESERRPARADAMTKDQLATAFLALYDENENEAAMPWHGDIYRTGKAIVEVFGDLVKKYRRQEFERLRPFRIFYTEHAPIGAARAAVRMVRKLFTR